MPPTAAPPTRPATATPADESVLLLAFLRSRDIPCPRCGYNLRDLRAPACPECGEALCLAVRRRRSRLYIFIALLTPGLFSAVAAVLLGIPLTLFHPPVWPPWVAEAFGILSAAVTLVLYRRKEIFFRRSALFQLGTVASVWTIHIIVLVLVINGLTHFLF
jgi:hypothetical protein